MAFEKALHSPLLNNNNIYKSKKILFNIYYNPNHPMKVGDLEEVNTFMTRFTEEDIEVIWGMSKDYNLEEGAVNVTVLATGFGMQNIPEMKPLLGEIEREQEAEKLKIQSMIETFYKEDFKVYIFDDADLDNEAVIAAVESSPTHKRMAKELQQIKSISSAAKQSDVPAEEPTKAVEEAPIEEADDEIPFTPMQIDNEENNITENSVEINY